MPSLYDIANLLVLPPVNLALLAALGWIWCRHRIGRTVTGITLAALLLLGMPLVASTLLASLEWGLPRAPIIGAAPATAQAQAPAPAQAIVVLGAEISAGQSDTGQAVTVPGPLTLERLRIAALLARRTGLPLLVSGGIVDPGRPPVGLVMAESLRTDFGLPPRWVEARSATTWENAADSAAMLLPDGIRTVLLVTDAWHERRALIAFAGTGIEAIPAPMQWDRPGEFSVNALLPHASDWLRSYYAMHEWIGCLWYRLHAWRAGRDI
jgi:uncharacterized SAM-binding protein YcdF (DUF218 family)